MTWLFIAFLPDFCQNDDLWAVFQGEVRHCRYKAGKTAWGWFAGFGVRDES
jgi:hypothetical protein